MAAAQFAVSFFGQVELVWPMRLAGDANKIWAGNKGRARTVGLSFIGEFSQKVDSKGRMSIPAPFRRVLEAGDTEIPDAPNPRIYIVYGPHLKDHLQAYTVAEMRRIQAKVDAMPHGSDQRKLANYTIISKTVELEVDRDGRIVLPKDRREQINLEGEAYMAAMGTYFEIWNAKTHSGGKETEMEALLAAQGDDFNPLTLLDGL